VASHARCVGRDRRRRGLAVAALGPLRLPEPGGLLVGCYVRAELLPDGRWRMRWRGFDVEAE
jgi:hypothetical protein